MNSSGTVLIFFNKPTNVRKNILVIEQKDEIMFQKTKFCDQSCDQYLTNLVLIFLSAQVLTKKFYKIAFGKLEIFHHFLDQKFSWSFSNQNFEALNPMKLFQSQWSFSNPLVNEESGHFK